MIGNITRRTKVLKVDYDGAKLEFTIKKMSTQTKNYVTDLMLRGRKMDVNNPSMIESVELSKDLADEGHREIILTCVIDHNLQNDKGDKLQWNRKTVDEILDEYSDLADILHKEIWDFTLPPKNLQKKN